jgi:hypothetical protein
MPTFTVSLIASIPVSAQVVVEADNEQDAVKLAAQLHSQARLGWLYNGLPIPAFNGPVASIWSSPGTLPGPGPKTSKTTLQVNSTVVPFGTPVTAVATIQPGATGLVTFYDGGTLLGSAVPNGLGVATLADINLPIGTQPIVAQFAGDLYLAPSTSNIVDVLVQAPATQTAVVAAPNPQNFGNNVTITATVTSTAGTPDGLVFFYDGLTQIGSGPLSGGMASMVTNVLAAGNHSLTAAYQGSSNFAPSTSPAYIETILTTATNTTVMSNLPSSIFEQLVVFTASVSSTFGPPTSGTVHFVAVPSSGPSIDLGTVGVDGSGNAAVSSATLPVGTYTIQATYSGNVNFQGSQGTTGQLVAAAPTNTAVVSSNSNAAFGVLVTWTATVTSTYGTVNAGSVTFVAIPTGEGVPITLGTQNVDGTGHASVSSSTLPAGSWTIQASYSGTMNFGASVGTTGQTIFLNTAMITVTDNPTSFNTLYLDGLVLRATLSGSGPTPTGTVTFYAGSTVGWPGDAAAVPGGSNITIVGGVAQVTIPSTSIGVGVYTISCSYSGDSNYSPVTYTVPTTCQLNVVDPFNIVNSTHATTVLNGNLTDNTVNFLAGGEYSVQVNDQLIMNGTGNVYQILAVSTNTLSVLSVINSDTGPNNNGFTSSDVGSNMSYTIESSNISPNQFWRLASSPSGTYNDWTVTVQQGTGAAPTPTGTLWFFYFPSGEFTQAPAWTQLGIVSNVTNSGGLIQIVTTQEHGYISGQQAVISGVVGVPANGTWTVTIVDSQTFTLNGSVFSGSYSSGGICGFLMSGGSATFHMDQGGADPFGGGLAQSAPLSVQYSGDSNYANTPNPNGDSSLPPGAPLLGGVQLEGAG